MLELGGDGVCSVANRIGSLDGLRGIAALTVAFSHSSAVYAQTGDTWGATIWDLLTRSVLSAGEAVVIFFILSGYVLSRSLARQGEITEATLWSFYLKRCFRILPAMWVAIVVTFAISRSFDLSDKQHLFTGWYHYVFTPRGGWQVLSNFALWSFDVVPNTWTMRIEMLGSLLTPLFFWVLSTATWNSKIAFGAVIMVAGFACGGDLNYMLAFYVGSVLARFEFSVGRNGPWFIIVGLSIVSACGLIPGGWHGRGFEQIIYTAGGALVLLGCRELPILGSPLFRSFGQISYSFYLYHSTILAVVAAATVPILKQVSPSTANFILFSASTMIAIPVAALSYRYVESRFKISGAIGKWLPVTAKVSP